MIDKLYLLSGYYRDHNLRGTIWSDGEKLIDGQQIIYETMGGTFYSLCIFTGETKKIELIN